MDSGDNEVTIDFSPLLRVYKSGRVERIFGSPIVPPSPEDPATGVASKDIDISPEIKARIYLPKLTNTTDQKLPILVYYHGGGFCLESAFSFLDQRYLNLIVAEANVIAVSVEYRLAPEHRLPVAYEDSWAALQWVGSHVLEDPGQGTVDFKEDSLASRIWVFVNPSAEDGVDDPRINPFVEKAQSLSSWGVRDFGEDHCFQIFDPETEKAKNLIKGMANFIKQSCM
ncbi:hypothetical protein HAX54_022345 [Datura stramonium]|uniref:Alpha/beta hydrolase fold-3 domain-containing protein n=1 Tax=Datura stramonium TaxID=4076 RepID=A0ABS8S7A0_DATST|nr:hypothetical protein [Datura stramonium]